MNRVVVTGLGPVSSIGIGVSAFTDGLREGRSGISPIRSFDASGFPHRNAGEVPGFRPEALLDRIDVACWGRSAQFAAAAARLALADSGLDPAAVAPERAGVVVGTTSGESVVVEAVTAQQVESGFGGMDPDLLRQVPAGRLAHAVSTELDLAGESLTLATACSASNYAIGYAYDMLATGEAEVMFAGGADSVCRWAHAGFYRLGALTADACSPFDRDRSGILTGEGGAILMLETLDHARARGARVYAEVLGYGVNCDANHPVAPDRGSIAACMRAAHRNASVKPADVDYICAHGTGTPANDSVEAQAIFDVFGDRVPPVSSIKSMMGHTMGAASGFGAIAGTLAIAHGFLPPTINWANPDPALSGLDPVPNTARQARVRVVQNNGFAFGGNNAIVLIGAVE
ncbi:beta-ketoacyl-[acyl-carrier-protein] synthase family protein [Micromonospora craniellae]|uniref:Beta-ketoacyl-[acyl-carrier-protein] synthase family protein n=1 Tax=Micromonospora craniellae TaxID=2294034 RepID=A0A372G0F3_9ACTN|nr:beta-ketoacyl-[acyl-carrier-protein] synthase family protein [Micromonospora craniellae]QOC91711.1 beta-ketoacyl-[acyl-carrier-protein] synthase family protein [Micromonospora craniellae]RFS46512.1 beta-ketoacyl-[acyl-carrier-protein] synthase family protein [Micromonospora craniellae]